MEFITLETLDGVTVHVRRDAIVSMRTAKPDRKECLLRRLTAPLP